VIVEIGGLPIPESRRSEDFSEVLWVSDLGFVAFVEAGSPEMIGGGSSKPSFAFLDICRAKSDACHHSRNLRAKIDVGSRIFRLDSSRGYTVCVIVLGLKMEVVWPGRAPGAGFGWVARAIALLSAAFMRLILVPINHRNGEWNFDPSNRYARLNASSEK